MTKILNPHTREVEIDTEIARLHGEFDKACADFGQAVRRVERVILEPALNGPNLVDHTKPYADRWLGDVLMVEEKGWPRRERATFPKVEKMGVDELAALAREILADAEDHKHLTYDECCDAGVYMGYHLKAEHVDGMEAAKDKVAEVRGLLTEAQKRYGGWARFFLVKNNGGHIHKDMDCQTCNKRGKATAFGWLPELAALTEAEAVAAYGAILCTVCYPTAPVEWTDGRKADDDLYCPADQGLDETKPIRRGYYGNNGGTCKACGQRVTVTKEGYGKIRKHKKEAAK